MTTQLARHRPPAQTPLPAQVRQPLAPSPALSSPTAAWVRSQVINVGRHAVALRPFDPREFGDGPAAPSPGQVAAVNRLLAQLGRFLEQRVGSVRQAAHRVEGSESGPALLAVVSRGEEAHRAVRSIEQVWDWYFEFFGQRQGRYADWLLGCDRIALDVYQDVYMGLGKPRSIPSPAPMTYMRTGQAPATYRRALRLRRLGLQQNPFPIVQIPYHRLVNPWTLGAVLHEISHNLQNELDLQQRVPTALRDRLTEAGLPKSVVHTWVRWNRETFADLFACLLGGPAIVGSLIDILARTPPNVAVFNPRAVHPLPLLRTRISTHLLERMGFSSEASAYRRMWDTAYHGIPVQAPAELIETSEDVIRTVVDIMCFTAYESLGRRSLAQVFSYAPKHDAMVAEAGERLARGTDPGIIPERFLIGASRFALDRDLAAPGVIAANFYADLKRR